MRLGKNQAVSNSAGINVEDACDLDHYFNSFSLFWTDYIFTNMGNMSTYNAHDQTGFFAAAILVGGALCYGKY